MALQDLAALAVKAWISMIYSVPSATFSVVMVLADLAVDLVVDKPNLVNIKAQICA